MKKNYIQIFIANLIDSSGMNIGSDQKDIYIYGLECFLNTGITILILSIWGFFAHTLFETICWIFSFSILRHHAGGYHAPTQLSCIFCSSLIGMSNFLFIHFFNLNIAWCIGILLILCIFFFLFAPTESTKSILSAKLKYHEKITSFLIIFSGFVMAICLPHTIFLSILYAFICVAILMIPVIIRQHN